MDALRRELLAVRALLRMGLPIPDELQAAHILMNLSTKRCIIFPPMEKNERHADGGHGGLRRSTRRRKPVVPAD